MAQPEDVRTLFVNLTAQCNLRCGYCYQNAKQPRRMRWKTLRASIDLALRSRHDEVTLMFHGGEPLLEFDLVRRAVEYTERRRSADKLVTYGLITNGLLLTDDVVDLITRYWFDTQLSMDGVPEVQALRGKGTFEALDGTLDRLRKQHPGYYRWHLTVSLTLLPQTIRHLARSVDYLMSKRLQQIEINPAVNMEAHWRYKHFGELDREFARIYRNAKDHYERQREVPVSLFARGSARRRDSPGKISMCGVMSGEVPVVDVDGQVHGCATFAESYQQFRTPFMRKRIQRLRLGDVGDRGLRQRYNAFPFAVKEAKIFHHKERKYSSYVRCGECEYLGGCGICPMSIGSIPNNTDPQRVPDFLCAYNMISLKYADRFARKVMARPASPRREDS